MERKPKRLFAFLALTSLILAIAGIELHGVSHYLGGDDGDDAVACQLCDLRVGLTQVFGAGAAPVLPTPAFFGTVQNFVPSPRLAAVVRKAHARAPPLSIV